MRSLKLSVGLAAATLLFGSALSGAGSAPEVPVKRVLMIATGSRLAPGFILVDQQLLHALANIPSVRVETYAENLDLVRFPSEHYGEIFSEYLTAKYARHPPDLVILIFVGNLGLPGKLLPQIFPGTPIIAAGLTEEEIRPDQFSPLVSGIAQRVNPRASLELILRLQPDVRRVVVIGGTADADRQVLQRVREAAQPFKGRVEIEFWDNLTMAQLRHQVAALTAPTAVLFTRMFRDGAGQAYVSSQVAGSIAELANVPYYTMSDANLAKDAVGGAVASVEAFGSRAGELARLVLSGTDIKSLPFEIRTDTIPTFSWPALKRWNIPESRLPPGSVLRFKPQTLWEQYFGYLIGALIIIAIQAGMIGALLVQRAKRRRVEAALRENQQLMELASSAGELGLWSRDLAGGYLWVNAPMRFLFGFGAQEKIRFEDILGRVHPDDRAGMVAELERTQAAALPYEGEFRIRAGGDWERWVVVKGRTVVESNGPGERRMGVVLDITERKRAEEQVRESEERFRVVANSAPVLIWISDTDKLRSFFNKGWLDFTGRTLEQELGNGWAEGVHAEETDLCLAVYVLAFDARQEFTVEYRLRRYDGEYRWMLDHGVPRIGVDGAFLGYIGTATDITERKRGEEKFRTAVEASPTAIVMVDDQGRILLVNAQGERLFGYKREDLIGRAAEILVPERYRKSHAAHRQNFIAAPEARTIGADRELFGLCQDGREVPIEIGLSPIHTADGMITLATIIDISEKKRSAAALENERAFLRQVIDTDPNFIFAKDRDGRFTMANRAVADAYGTTVDNLIGRSDEDFNANQDEVASFRRVDLEVIDTLQEKFIPEERITDAQGRVRWLQTVKRPILDNDGTASQVLGASTDITRRKETEAELQEQRAELAHVARISTMGELAASLAHELNQPLTAILSNAQAALRFMSSTPADMEEVREILHDIVNDNSRAGEVIRRMRALVKKEDLEFTPVDLNGLACEVVALVHSDAILQNVDIALTLDADLPAVQGDKVQLQQVVINLLLNAFDAMQGCRTNERKVELRVERNGGGVIQGAVSDCGTGLSRDKFEKIFQPFYTTKGEGLGMGLSICRSIIEAHGGRLWAENNAERGATFYFTLPVSAENRITNGIVP